MEPTRSEPPQFGLDPALMADPDAVLERVLRTAGPSRTSGVRASAAAWDEPPRASFDLGARARLRRAAGAVMIVLVGTGIGLAVAGLPH